jgi:perosamine synthetase
VKKKTPRRPSAEPGTPQAGFIPLSVPEIGGNEWRYIKECLDTGWVSSVGSFVDRFERELASKVGTRHAVACSSGTAALHVALILAGVKPDDEVLVSDLTFIAPANAVRYVGAWPVFIDAEPEYWQMDPQKVEDFLTRHCRSVRGELRNKKSGRRVKAVMPVHVLGHPVDLDPIIERSRRHGLAVVEDATECLGARYKGRPVGSAGDVSCFSFNGNKVITTGGGGMVVTDNAEWAKRARYLTTQAKDDPIEFVHGEIGYNYRLTNIQAAMGCAQLELLDEYVARKRRTAAAYARSLADVPGMTPMRQAPWAESIWWMYTVLVDRRRYGLDSRALLRRLEEAGIQARPLWQPMHRSPAHRGLESGSFPVAERLNRDGLSLPCSVGLTRHEQARVTDVIRAHGRPGEVAG